jgi:hypothetical protein
VAVEAEALAVVEAEAVETTTTTTTGESLSRTERKLERRVSLLFPFLQILIKF